MIRHLPNLLTLSRLPIALAIFLLLAMTDIADADRATPLLIASLGLFVLAILTDIFDGIAARRLGACSQYGRMIDALLDKLLICGTFAFFLSPGFFLLSAEAAAVGIAGIAGVAGGTGGTGGGSIENVTGVKVWMVAVIFIRELLVTGLRTSSENRGRQFAATFFGKAKMTLQSMAIIAVMFILAGRWHTDPAAIVIRDLLLYVAVIFTALSALAYLGRAARLLHVTSTDAEAAGESTVLTDTSERMP